MENLFVLEQRLLCETSGLLEDISLANLRKHKYSNVDLSPLSKYVLTPYWNWVTEQMPLWLAPNLITLIGISAIVLANGLILIYCPDLETEAPRWVYLFFAFALFFYQTMDNVDGKQARRTGSSSPLGELFDHGIDSLNCCWGPLCEVASIGLGSTGMGAFTALGTCIAMYMSSWENYHTHTLFLGYLNGPTEGLLIATIVHLLAFAFGPGIWNYEVFGMSLKVWWTVALVLSIFIAHVPACIYNVYKATEENSGDCSFAEALRGITPLCLMAVAVTLWLSGPNSRILADNYLILFAWTIGFVFARCTTCIILSHMCNQPFPRQSLVVMPLYTGAIIYGLLPRFGLTFPLSEFIYLWAYFAFATLYFSAYTQLVIDRLTSYLGIRCLTISARLD